MRWRSGCASPGSRRATGPAREHHDAVHRLAELPGFGVDSAQQLIAETKTIADALREGVDRTVSMTVACSALLRLEPLGRHRPSRNNLSATGRPLIGR